MAHSIRKVGVIGAGQMGNGIAHVCALAGLEVRLNDDAEDKIDKRLVTIYRHLARQVAQGAISDAYREAALARIKPALSYEAFGDCDIVIEAATENEQL